MIVRMFQRILLNVEHNYKVPNKYFYYSNASCWTCQSTFSKNKTVGYLSNERGIPRKNISLPQQMHTNLYRGPLLCKSIPVIACKIPINQCSTVNNNRQYSTSIPEVVSGVLKHNVGYIQIISESLPVEYMMNALSMIHDQTGLPWWATIMLSSVLMRACITSPLAVHDCQIKARIMNIMDELKPVTDQLKMEARAAITSGEMTIAQAQVACKNALKEERSLLYQEHNCHPFKSVAITLLQLPIWICFIFSLRNICFMLPDGDSIARQRYQEFTEGGFGWFQNLTEIDHLYILPVIFGIVNLLAIEVNEAMYSKLQVSKAMRFFRYFQRIFVIFFACILSNAPSCLTLYWITHTSYILAQNLVLLSPKVRKLVRIPVTKFEISQPYIELYKQLKCRVGLK